MKTKTATMKKSDVLNFKVGQLAEMKTFEQGYRGAWFRCKITEIYWERFEIKPEYYDFPGEDIVWTKIYQLPPYGRKSKSIKKQLMLRPQYPPMYQKSQMPHVNSISDVVIVIDGTWKVGDLVDWCEEHCFWSARVIKVLNDHKVQIELPMPPAGEGGPYVALCKDLRPSLNWSPEHGWTLPTVEGRTACGAQLIFPSKQGTNPESNEVQVVASSPLHASSSSHVSANSLAFPIESNTERPTSTVLEGSPKSREVQMEGNFMETTTRKTSSSDSISTSQFQEIKEETEWEEDLGSLNGGNIPLNIMHQDTLEAPILDFEELANKIKWMKSLLQGNPLSNNKTSSWKFVEHCSSSTLR